MAGREVATPAVGDDEPGTEAAPGFDVLAAVGEEGSVGQAEGDVVAADFDGEVAGGFDTDGFEAEVLVSGVAELAEEALDGLGTVGGVVVRSHEGAVLGEEGGDLIVVTGVERGDEILGEVADKGLHVQKRTRVRNRTGIGPVHLLPPGGRPRTASAARRTTSLRVGAF